MSREKHRRQGDLHSLVRSAGYRTDVVVGSAKPQGLPERLEPRFAAVAQPDLQDPPGDDDVLL